jgi:hypothetical protein
MFHERGTLFHDDRVAISTINGIRSLARAIIEHHRLSMQRLTVDIALVEAIKLFEDNCATHLRPIGLDANE